jgi:hypothetical protein
MSTFHSQSVGCKPNLGYQSRSLLREFNPERLKQAHKMEGAVPAN